MAHPSHRRVRSSLTYDEYARSGPPRRRPGWTTWPPNLSAPFSNGFLVRFARAFGLAVLLFPVGLATHEVMHLVVYSALGVRAALLVTSWRLGSLGVPIFGLHSAPVGPDGVPLGVLVANNGLGPLLAALLLLALLLAIDRRSRAARAALLGNVLALVFFSCIEVAYPLLEEVGHVNADVLLLPELNYGIVLLILLATTFGATGSRPLRPLRTGGSSASATPRAA